MLHLAYEFAQCVGWNGTALWRLQSGQPFRRFAQSWIETTNAEAHQCCLHAIDDPGALANQLRPLAVWSFGVFLRQSWDRDHTTVFLLAAQPT